MGQKEIPKIYNPQEWEDKIYGQWEKKGYFKPQPGKAGKKFSIAMPPPNATGELHIGHAMMLVIQDIMIRYHRMLGDETLWLPGIDHAAIATQNKVESMLLKKGITRQKIGRVGLLQEIEKYVADSRSTIENQVRKMGSSCDWSRERYTLDNGLSIAVRTVFVRMHKDGLIYRGERIVHWCSRCSSTLSDDEVEYKETKGKLYFIKYGPLVLATTRPETKLGDTALAVHPSDRRYKKYVGKILEAESAQGKIKLKVIADSSVDPKFGTGVIKVTPAHDFSDFEIGKRHGLETRQVIGEDGLMTKLAGKYAGLTAKQCREKILKDLSAKGLVEKIEDYTLRLSVCYRCSMVIEPLISKQWFIDVNKKSVLWKGKKYSLKQASLKAVKDAAIKIIPERFNKVYYHWINNLHDWCISRQIWFGHQIPVWYCVDCSEIIASIKAPKKCSKCRSDKLNQDNDTLDTWFSAALWTFSTLGWPQKTSDLKKFHPTSVLETGYDILFFWVAKMIMMTTYVIGDIPFKYVYLHGLVRDGEGRKMSKLLGNGIDPVDMTEKFGADATRLSLIMGTTPGQDIRLYEEKIAGYRNFINKLWNISRFVFSRVEKIKFISTPPKPKTLWDKYILLKLDEISKLTQERLDKFQFSPAAEELLEFTWHEFADWYVEVSKIEEGKDEILLYVLQRLLILIHPFAPFVTEVIWKELKPLKPLIVSDWPTLKSIKKDSDALKKVKILKDFIQKARQGKINSRRPSAEFSKVYPSKNKEIIIPHKAVIEKLARIEIVGSKKEALFSF